MSDNPGTAKSKKKVLFYCGIHNLGNFSRIRSYYDLCYGFDANPDKIARARQAYEKDPNVKFVHGALTDKGGEEAEFTITTDWDPASSLGNPNPDYVHMKTGVLAAQKKIKVPTVNLYDFCIDNGIDEIDTLITDLQGIDFTVLKTLTEFIKKGKIREIQCEVEPDDSPTRYIGIPPSKLKDFKKLLSGNYDLLWIDPLTPPEDAWEMDARWRVKGGTPQDGIEFVLENDFLVAKAPSLLINIVYAHLAQQEFFIVHRGNVSILWTPIPVQGCDLYAYHDAFSFRGESGAVDVLIMLEPMVVLPGEYDDEVWRRFDHVLTLCDALPEADKERFTKILFPRSCGRENKPITEDINERNRLYPVAGRKSGICVISGNKQSSVPGEIYSKRFETAKWFSEHSDYPFDVYGIPAFPLKNYLGRIPPDDKFKVLSQYRYCLCFENTNHPVFSRGYITEKILDCLEARTVPIYLGAANIEEYIPRDCFIDFRDFAGIEEFESFMKSMPEDRYKAYVRAIDEWAAAGNLRKYSWEAIYDHLAELCSPVRQASSLFLREMSWSSGFSPAHAKREFKVDQLPQMWTWNYLAETPSPCLQEDKGGDAPITSSTLQKVAAFHKKDRLKVLYAGLKYNYGDPRRGYDYGIWNMFDALHRFENIDVDLFDFVTESRTNGVAGMSSRLLDTVEKNKYDLLFYISFDKQADVLHDIMAHITNHTETITAVWMSDDHWRFDNYSSLWAPHTDYVITTSKEALGKYKAKGFGPKAIKSQWACNPFTYKPLPLTGTRDISFVGMAHGNRPQIMEELAKCGLKADVFGFGWNGSVDICFYDMLKIFNETKINLNLSNSSTITTQQIKGRNFEVPGCGGFLLTTPAEDLEECFAIDKEVVVASTMEEIIDKSRYYLAHDSEREAIALKSYERTLSEHTWMHRFTDIFGQMGFNARPILPSRSGRSSFAAFSPETGNSGKWFTSRDPVTKEVTAQAEPEELSSIIVIAYNQLDYTRQCVESILHYTSRPYELLLVDNGSTDDTYAYYKEVQKVHPHVRIIKAWSNRVVEGLFNHAASVARGKYIVFTSNDTIVHENWLENFIDQINAAKDIGIVGPRSNSISGPQSLFIRYTSLEEYHTAASKLSIANKGASFQVQRMVGMTFITRKDILQRVGGMDTDLPTNGKDGGYGFSDDDMSVRFIAAGYKLVVADDVFIHHFGSVTILKDQPDAYGKSQNINRVKFERNLAANPQVKKKEDGTFFVAPMTLEDNIDVPDRCAVHVPQICLAFINGNGENRPQQQMPEITGYSVVTKSFSDKSFYDWFKGDEVHRYDYLALVQTETAQNELPALIETAMCLPDTAILVPEETDRENDHPQDVKFIPLADLSIAVLNMKLARTHLNILSKFPEMEKGLLFLQRRLTGEGYFITRTPAITRKTEAVLRTIEHLPEDLLEKGNIEEAKAIYTADVEIDPSFSKSFYQLAIIALEENDPAGAIGYLTKAMDSDENYLPAYLLSANIAMLADNLEAAQSCLDAAFSKQPKNPEVVKAMDELAKRKNRTIADSPETAPDKQIEVIFAQATLAVSQGRSDDACLLFENFIANNPDLGVAYAGYGSILIGMEHFDKAKEVLQKAVSLLPSEIDPLLQLVQAQASLNELEEAEKTVRTALALDNGNAVAISRLVDILCDMGKTGDAITEITAALQKDPANADLIAVFGGLANRLGNMEGLAMCLKKLRETNPDHTAIPFFHNILASNGYDDGPDLLRPEPPNTSAPSAASDAAEQQFINDLERYEAMTSRENPRFPLDRRALLPCLKEKTDVLDFDRHYFFHTAWAAAVLREINPPVHTDISSTMHFIAVISAFVPVNYYEFRAPDIHMDNLKTGSADITALPFPDGGIGSLSCMHAVEHIGLGRYGDPVNPEGDLKAIAELQRVLKEGGDLLFVVPIGKPKLLFNAHRIYSYAQIRDYFNQCELREFALIPDKDLNGRSLIRNASPNLADQQNYGCGCFWFKKLPSTNTGLRQRKDVEPPNKTTNTAPQQLTSIILYGADSSDALEKCLASIEKLTCEPHEVLVESSLHTINNALVQASGKYIAILDSSTTVTEGWLTGMLACLESAPNAGLVGPVTNNPVLNRHFPDFKNDEDALEAFAASFRKRNARRRSETMKISGSCMVFKKDLIEKTGMPDSSFSDPALWGADFSILALLAGYDNFVAGDVFVLSNGPSQAAADQELFNAKWGNIPINSPKGRRASALIAVNNARGSHMKDKLSDAISALMEGIKSAPDEKEIYIFLASILLDAKLYDEVTNTIQSMPETSREIPEALSLAGLALEALNRDEDAAECVDKMLAQRPDYAPALNLKGLLLYKKGSAAEALRLFQQASTADPGYADPYRNMGLMKWTDNDKEGALNLFEKAFILGPQWMDNAVSYHTAAVELGALERAERIIRDALVLYPQEKRIVFILIDVLLKEEKFEAAMAEIEEAITSFDVDDGILAAALDVRKKVGPMQIDDNETRGTLSVCIITKNEEKYIARCLAGLKPVADEIIVVDTGSTDKTKPIAEAFGAQVIDLPWNNDFSEARNASLERAKGSWILVHDADETISALDYKWLRAMIDTKPATPAAYTLVTRNYITNSSIDGWVANKGEYPDEESGTGWFPSSKVRLFTRDSRFRFRNPVHEVLEPSIIEAGVVVNKFDMPIHHFGRLNEDNSRIKMETYYQLGKKKLELAPQNPVAIRELAIQAAELGRHDEALNLWNEYLAYAPNHHLAHFNMSTSYLESGQFDKALKAAERALALDPDVKESILCYAAASLCCGNIEDAILSLEKLLQRVPGYPPAQASLAAAYSIEGKEEQGLALLKELKKKNYECSTAFYSLALKLVAAGLPDYASTLLKFMKTSGHAHPEGDKLLNEISPLP